MQNAASEAHVFLLARQTLNTLDARSVREFAAVEHCEHLRNASVSITHAMSHVFVFYNIRLYVCKRRKHLLHVT